MSCPVLPTGLGEDYWSMEDILAGQERIPCKIEQTLYRLGFLSTHSGEEHLVPGTKMEVPLWLARSLCTRRRQVISVSLPKSYREGMRVALSADANVVNLYRNGPYYYAVGISLLNFDLPERGDLAKCLLEAFVKRFRGIMDSSQNAYQLDLTQLTSNLDEMERYLFTQGQQALNKQIQWEQGKGKTIKTSSLVEGSRKRKRDN